MNYPKTRIHWEIFDICSEDDLEYLPTPSGEIVDDFMEQDNIIHQEDSYD